jgi:transcriptional regulator with XRE-family HTH domain
MGAVARPRRPGHLGSPVVLHRGGRVSKDELRAAFGDAVKRARAARGWTLRELARRCEVAPNAVSQWESGRGAREDSVAKLEEVFGFPDGHLGWMLGYSLPPPSVSAEAAIAGDPSIPDEHKATLLAHLAEVRRIVEADGRHEPRQASPPDGRRPPHNGS